MKQLFLFAAFLICTCAVAQTKEKKNNITLGGGRQSYNGDLGNSWFKPHEEWYGFVKMSYSRYLTKSFDGMLMAFAGELGHCRDEDDPITNLNYRSRMYSGFLALKYKFANGYILKEEAKIAPYLFAGAGINSLTDIWNHKDVNPGSYGTVNCGIGVRYNFTPRISLGYDISFAYFMSDKLDYIVRGGNDMYMQNYFYVGFNF